MSGRAIFVTPAAAADMDDIWEYIARDDPIAADRVISELADAMRMVAEKPGIGHLRTDLAAKSLRFCLVRSYLIVYRPDSDPLVIARVLSGHRDLESILSGEGA